MNAAHLHLMLNHIPVLGSYIIFIFTAAAIATKNQTLTKLSLQLMVLLGLMTLATFLTGEPAEEVIEHLAGVEESYLEHHEQLALYGLLMTELLAFVGLFNLIRSRKAEVKVGTVFKILFVISLINAGLMAFTANSGGEIRHTEIRKDGL